MPYTLVVLISGHGSNLQAIIDQAAQRGYEVIGVISNQADAYGLERAKMAGISFNLINHQDFDSRSDFDAHLQQAIDHYNPDLVVLAGFMRRLGQSIVEHFAGRMINIHPSLLPKYRGLHTHQRVLAAGEKEHGLSIHFVTPTLDGGPIICQSQLSISPQDSEETLIKRIQSLEHQIYPQVIEWFAQKRLFLRDNCVYFDQECLPSTGQQIKLNHIE